MTKIELLVFIIFAALACASEEESEQKKRGAGKATSLNSIPTGSQKPDYTYNIYQSPSSQTSQASPTYQAQVPNSFYPNQNSQYYAPSTQTDHYNQPQSYLIPPTTPSQFLPLNFVPNPGYQAKYLVPSKSGNGNIQLILQQPQGYQSPLLQYPQTLLQSNPHSHFQPQQGPLLNPISPQGHFNVPNYQSFLGGYNLGQPSPMLLVAQPNPSLYNNFVYPNQGQNLYNYYPSNSQTKYAASYPSTSQTTEYDKAPVQQSVSKEDNDISLHNNDYVSAPSDTSYKNYATSRSSNYSKL